MGSKVTAILLRRWIFPIGLVPLGRVCAQMQSRLVLGLSDVYILNRAALLVADPHRANCAPLLNSLIFDLEFSVLLGHEIYSGTKLSWIVIFA